MTTPTKEHRTRFAPSGFWKAPNCEDVSNFCCPSMVKMFWNGKPSVGSPGTLAEAGTTWSIAHASGKVPSLQPHVCRLQRNTPLEHLTGASNNLLAIRCTIRAPRIGYDSSFHSQHLHDTGCQVRNIDRPVHRHRGLQGLRTHPE